MALVSIILPTRDRAPELSRAVASVLAQTYPDWELLIVDNNRVEPPVERQPMRPRDERIRVLREPLAASAAAARNVGLAAARGEWLTYLDDDDAYRPEKIARQLGLAKAAGAPLVLCGGCYHLARRRRNRVYRSQTIGGDALLVETYLGMPFLLHRRAAAVRFAEELSAGEDVHYAHALLAEFALDRVPVVPEPLVDVYQPLRADRTNLRAEAVWRASRRVWWQFGGRFSAAARRAFVIRALITRAKLQRRPAVVFACGPAFLRSNRGWSAGRFWLNALAASLGLFPGRWVS